MLAREPMQVFYDQVLLPLRNMKSSTFAFFFLGALCFSSTQSTDLVDQICQKTPFYKLCVNSLGSYPQPTSTDVKGISATIANVILSNATDTLSFIHLLIKNSSDTQLEKTLAYCAELYIPVVMYNIPQAIVALGKGQFGFAIYAIADAAKQAMNCEKSFSASNGSPLTDRNNELINLCNVAVAVMTSFVKGRRH